jgi:hypothetical protein
MRLSKIVLFAALVSPGLVATAFAQHGGGGHGGGGGGHAGGGGAHSGGGFSGGVRGGSVGGFRGGAVGGFRGGVGRGYYYGGRWYGGSGLYLGFGGYPYYGYYGYPYYGYGYDPYYYGTDPYGYDGSYSTAPAPQQNYGYGQGYPQQGYPQQGYPQQGYPQQAYPQQGYPQQGQGQVGPPPGAPQQTQPQAAVGAPGQYYLIAFTDHTIQAANAYKVEGDQLYWQDRDNREHHVPLSKVDVPFSQQINRDRSVNFQIP